MWAKKVYANSVHPHNNSAKLITRTDIVQKENKDQNQGDKTFGTWDQVMRMKKGETNQVGRSYKKTLDA